MLHFTALLTLRNGASIPLELTAPTMDLARDRVRQYGKEVFVWGFTYSVRAA